MIRYEYTWLHTVHPKLLKILFVIKLSTEIICLH